MTFPLLRLATALLAAGGLRATEPARRAGSSAAEEALSGRSIYNLDATWTDDAGQKMRLAELRGHPAVLAMFFTQCQGACPLIISGMQRIQARLPAAVRAETRFVLISFDSARDTSAALHAYRQGLGLPAGTWTLLMGEPAEVQDLAMVLGVQFQRVGDGQYAHSNLVTILNRQGEIAYQRSGVAADDPAILRALELAVR